MYKLGLPKTPLIVTAIAWVIVLTIIAAMNAGCASRPKIHKETQVEANATHGYTVTETAFNSLENLAGVMEKDPKIPKWQPVTIRRHVGIGRGGMKEHKAACDQSFAENDASKAVLNKRFDNYIIYSALACIVGLGIMLFGAKMRSQLAGGIGAAMVLAGGAGAVLFMALKTLAMAMVWIVGGAIGIGFVVAIFLVIRWMKATREKDRLARIAAEREQQLALEKSANVKFVKNIETLGEFIPDYKKAEAFGKLEQPLEIEALVKEAKAKIAEEKNPAAKLEAIAVVVEDTNETVHKLEGHP